MQKPEKIGSKDVYAVALCFLVAFGIWQFVPKTTLPEFAVAGMVRASLSGGEVPAYISIAALLESAYASIAGLQADSAGAIAGFLLVFPPVLAGLCAVAAYFALRTLDFRKSESAFVSMLFSLSLCALAFLPGVYSPQQLACAAFFLFLVCLALHAKREGVATLALSIALAAIAALTKWYLR